MKIRNKQNIQRKKEINTLPTIMYTIVYLILKLRGPLKKKSKWLLLNLYEKWNYKQHVNIKLQLKIVKAKIQWAESFLPALFFSFSFIVLHKYSMVLRFNPFHAAGIFLYPLRIPENQRFSDIFRGYRKRPLAWNR